jgi:glutaredoxin
MKMSSTLVRSGPLGLALLLGAAGAGAQMYKWTDARGVIHYSDQPPAGKDTKVETKAFGGGARQVELPYALAEAVRGNPVVLYTTAGCKACDAGRVLLKQRGIPFSEKTVKSSDDQQKLKEAGGDGQLPLLVIGSTTRIGFEAGAWHEALTSAAYPAQKILPANYQYPAAVPAAPARALAGDVVRDEVRDQESPAAARPKAPPPPGETPPGFRF